MTVRLSALHTGSPILPRKNPGTHFCHMAEGHSAAGRSRSIVKSNDFIGNQIRDLPACSIVPQPTTLLRYFVHIEIMRIFIVLLYYFTVLA
jgi:hypothetical protein